MEKRFHRQDAIFHFASRIGKADTEKTPRKDLLPEEEAVASAIVDAAVKVHSHLGPGLLERVYELCLAHELEIRGHRVETQVGIPIHYEGIALDAGLRLDMVVDGLAIIELKAVESALPVHEAQIITYLKLSGIRLGFLLNFNVKLMKDGISRRILERGMEPRL
ncbi:MAG: GxxExxY protein [Acidobacteria bacterium]|nr:GxxExxY protein [Acidobacteriota bacterium]